MSNQQGSSESETMLNDPKFYMITNLFKDGPYEIIAVNTDKDYNTLLNFRRCNSMLSVIYLPHDMAYKAIEANGGYGIGCWTPTEDPAERRTRRISARYKIIIFQEAKGARTFCPAHLIELRPTVLDKRERKPILTLHSFTSH
jgi:hypothetical protein